MKKEDKEIVDRLADIACSYNPQAMDYPNVVVFRKDLIGLVNICDRLEQQLKKKQDVIDKAIEYINNLTYWYEYSGDTICSLEDKFKSELLEILEDKEVE